MWRAVGDGFTGASPAAPRRAAMAASALRFFTLWRRHDRQRTDPPDSRSAPHGADSTVWVPLPFCASRASVASAGASPVWKSISELGYLSRRCVGRPKFDSTQGAAGGVGPALAPRLLAEEAPVTAGADAVLAVRETRGDALAALALGGGPGREP